MTVSAGKEDASGVSRRGRRRRWSAEEKRRIVAESEAPGSSVSLVARRHDLNANLPFTWRRRFRRQPEAGVDRATFVPAVIAPDEPLAGEGGAAPRATGAADEESSARRASGLMEIVLAGGRRVIVDREVSAAAPARVLEVPERR
jgi:transposase